MLASSASAFADQLNETASYDHQCPSSDDLSETFLGLGIALIRPSISSRRSSSPADRGVSALCRIAFTFTADGLIRYLTIRG
ncbi:hypothetical protein [Microbacterium phyllosphaerae]|uniref:hypothetical protein n=1 Tax=Microbacterium phyllosphaerae TaxID=124798 RepID=UPI003D65243C